MSIEMDFSYRSDHIQLIIGIPPKYSASGIMGVRNGRASLCCTTSVTWHGGGLERTGRSGLAVIT